MQAIRSKDTTQTLGRLLRFLHGREKAEYAIVGEAPGRYEMVAEELPGYGLPNE